MTFIMLNPSTADALVDDPTIRRCIGFAKAWGHGGLVVVNLYAFRATNPLDLLCAADPIGPANGLTVLDVLVNFSSRVIAAWGASPFGVPPFFRDLFTGMKLECLGRTQEGHPRHPLYVAASTKPEPFTIAPPDRP